MLNDLNKNLRKCMGIECMRRFVTNRYYLLIIATPIAGGKLGEI
jgi:hypothetical protein